MAESVESRAVTIAAQLMVAAGMCLHEDRSKCRHVYADAMTCEKCIRAWLLRKAKKELKENGKI